MSWLMRRCFSAIGDGSLCHLLSIFFLLGAELFDVGGGDYAGGEGYDCYAKEAADHAYESAHVAKGYFF